MDIDGLQTSIQTGGTPGERDFLPVDDNTIWGFEGELTAALTQRLQMTLNYGYLDTELGEDSVDSPVATFYLVDAFSFAPENSLTLAFDYLQPLNNGELQARIGYAYQDKEYLCRT